MTSRAFLVLYVFWGLVPAVFALDREAFTFANYDLTVRIEPEQHRLAVRGKLTVRNDSQAPQKEVCLQISSTLGWRAIRVSGKPVQFVSQTYTSDIDHTGALTEAIVILPDAVLPGRLVEMEIGYEGLVPLDATRLTRIGVPEKNAFHTDWDQIGPEAGVVRGIGYVAWYPVATEAANLSQGNSVAETVQRWKTRHAQSSMRISLESSQDEKLYFSAGSQVSNSGAVAHFDSGPFGLEVPVFATGNYEQVSAGERGVVHFLPGNGEAGNAAGEMLRGLEVPDIGLETGRLRIFQLPDPHAAVFVSGDSLFTPLAQSVTQNDELTAVYAITREAIVSPRAWIREGLAHFAQIRYLEQEGGRPATLEYLTSRREALAGTESAPSGAQPPETGKSLISSTDDARSQLKAAWVWSMLRDMVGDDALARALRKYQPAMDNEPSYVQRLLEAESKKDLEWFFDDWVYRDWGLPDFRIESVYPRKLLGGNYLVTVTVENLGNTGAEVPVSVRFKEGETTTRLEVRGKAHASIRVTTASPPDEAEVNDGSVPEGDSSNNVFKVEAAPASP